MSPQRIGWTRRVDEMRGAVIGGRRHRSGVRRGERPTAIIMRGAAASPSACANSAGHSSGGNRMTREAMEYDVVIVGGGPSGLAAAIRLKQLAAKQKPRGLGLRPREGFGDRRAHPVRRGHRSHGAERAPSGLAGAGRAARHAGDRGPLPDPDARQGLSHSELAAAAADEQPRQLHREPRQRLPLARAAGRGARRRDLSRLSRPPRCCYDDDGAVRGVATGDMGVARDGTHKPDYQPGMELHAKYTLFAEGCRGSLSQELMQQLQPARRRRSAEVRHRHQGAVAGRTGAASQGTRRAQPGLAARRRHRRRLVPLSLRRRPRRGRASSSISITRTRTCRRTTSSSASRRIPRSAARSKAASGSRYGARAINEGGLQSVPKLAFPGGALIGCAAGFVNLPRIKGRTTR